MYLRHGQSSRTIHCPLWLPTSLGTGPIGRFPLSLFEAADGTAWQKSGTTNQSPEPTNAGAGAGAGAVMREVLYYVASYNADASYLAS